MAHRPIEAQVRRTPTEGEGRLRRACGPPTFIFFLRQYSRRKHHRNLQIRELYQWHYDECSIIQFPSHHCEEPRLEVPVDNKWNNPDKVSFGYMDCCYNTDLAIKRFTNSREGCWEPGRQPNSRELGWTEQVVRIMNSTNSVPWILLRLRHLPQFHFRYV